MLIDKLHPKLVNIESSPEAGKYRMYAHLDQVQCHH
jgi:hypothetical protein